MWSLCFASVLADALNLQNVVAKLLVDYVDALLRKGGLKNPPEESQIEGRLDDLITLYVYSAALQTFLISVWLNLFWSFCRYVHLKDKDVFNQCLFCSTS